MARYIDADKLEKHLPQSVSKHNVIINGNEYPVFLVDHILHEIRNYPTADVVPKSEVERLNVELDAMRGAANTYKMHYENAMKEIERLKDYNTGVAFKHYFDGRKEVARDIFEEIESKKTFLKDCVGNMSVVVLFKDISELKKKYTEDIE